MWFSLSCFMMSASWQRWPWSLRPDILTLDPKYPNQSKPPHDGNTKAQAAHQAAQNSVWRRVVTLHAIETLGSVVTLTNHAQPMKLPISTNAIYECGEIHIDCYIFQYSWVLVIIYIYYIISFILFIFEGSLEVKLPTIWADEKQSRAEAERRGRLEERRSEEKE